MWCAHFSAITAITVGRGGGEARTWAPALLLHLRTCRHGLALRAGRGSSSVCDLLNLVNVLVEDAPQVVGSRSTSTKGRRSGSNGCLCHRRHRIAPHRDHQMMLWLRIVWLGGLEGAGVALGQVCAACRPESQPQPSRQRKEGSDKCLVP